MIDDVQVPPPATTRGNLALAADPYADLPTVGELAAQGQTDPDESTEHTDRFIDGATFILDAPTEIPAVWGNGSDVLWAEGESLMICGGNGVGKTTLATQLLRARLGLTSRVLGQPVAEGNRRVLYLAMDRPSQIRRAMHRSFTPDERDVLAALLVFWPGPPIADMAQRPFLLRQMCEKADADTVIVDSLKDAAIGLSADETGAAYNRARQAALAAGVQVLELHHLVKRNANGGEPKDIADIYGSAWLTAGAGSVVLLSGQPGDPVVSFRHLKQPIEELGPWQLIHDHTTGTSSIQGHADPFAILRASGTNGLTARRLAESLFDTTSPTPAQLQKARRKLDKLATDGLAHRIPQGGPSDPDLYLAAAHPGTEAP